MTSREQVINTLQAHKSELSGTYGVRSLALFGSLARDEGTDQSDVDLLVEFDCAVGYFGLVALQDHLADLLGRPVDLGTLASLKPRIRQQVEQDRRFLFHNLVKYDPEAALQLSDAYDL